MNSPRLPRTMVQCDFDGTITEEDVSFVLLDAFAEGDWRQLWQQYRDGKISVGAFNTRAFAMVKADSKSVTELIFSSGIARIRPGFRELLGYCSRSGIGFNIVSNGLDFYISAILQNLGLSGIPFHAARSRFRQEGMLVQYIGPDGRELEDRFKEAFTQRYLEQGYQVVYVGNGASDIHPARRSQHVFATGDLLTLCRETGLGCTPFDDLNDVVRGLERLPG